MPVKKTKKSKKTTKKTGQKVVEKHYYHNRPRYDDEYYPRRRYYSRPRYNPRQFNLNSYIDQLFSPYSRRGIRNTLNRSRNIRNNTTVPRRQRLKNQMGTMNNMFIDAQRQHGFNPVSLVNDNVLSRVDNMSDTKFKNTWNLCSENS